MKCANHHVWLVSKCTTSVRGKSGTGKSERTDSVQMYKRNVILLKDFSWAVYLKIIIQGKYAGRRIKKDVTS